MKMVFVGRTRPYPRKNGGGIAYGVVVGLPDSQEGNCIQRDTYFGSTTSALDAKFQGIEPGTLLDLDASPRVIQGKFSGFDSAGIHG